MTIQKDRVVTMHYHLTNTNDGQVLDSSRGSDPLTYVRPVDRKEASASGKIARLRLTL